MNEERLPKYLKDALDNAKRNMAEKSGLEKMRVRLTFCVGLLGTSSGNKDIHSEYIASKAPDAMSREEEVALLGVDEVEKKDMTVFPRCTLQGHEGKPFIYDYQIRGYFKEAFAGLKRCGLMKEVKAHKQVVNNAIFVQDRQNPIEVNGSIDSCQRPLRGNVAGVEVIALANSEYIAPGSTVEFTVMFPKEFRKYIEQMLDYGCVRGFLQWRNSGAGSFIWEELNEVGETIGGNAKA